MRSIALLYRFCAKALCFGLMFQSAACLAAMGGETLSKAREVLGLTSSQARQNLPVALHGVVTFSAPAFQLWFMQDDTGGIYFYPTQPDALELRPGDEIELTGVTGQGRFSPFVYGAKPKKIGEGILPHPLPIAAADLLSGFHDCQYIQVQGVVQHVTVEPMVKTQSKSLLLELNLGGKRVQINAMNFPSDAWEPAVDEEVRATGVAGTTYDTKGKLVGSLVFVDGPTNFVRLAEPPAPSSLPVRNSQDLFGYVPPGQQGHRAKYQGTVLLAWPEGWMILRDQEGAVRIHILGTPGVKPGDTAEALGFRAADMDGNYLDDGTVRSTGTATLSPIRFSVAGVDEFTNRSGGDIVRLEGTLLKSVSEQDGRHCLEIWDGRNVLRACAPAETSVPASALGARVSIAGVLLPGDRGNTVPELWLPEASDMKVLGRGGIASGPSPLWWIPLGIALGLLAAEVLWRNRRRQPANLRSLPPPIFAPDPAVPSADGTASGLSEERQRIARDLHDGVIQSLYAIGLGLEDCKTAAGGNRAENIERRLQKTVNDLNQVIREVRGFIAGLASEGLKPQELKPALKSLALTLGEAHQSKFSLEIEPEAVDMLDSARATQLLHFAREAFSNCIRHSGARSIVVSLRKSAQGRVRFEVVDDGTGFAPEKVQGGWGLKNLASRAKDVHGEFHIVSKPGSGTRVILDLPFA